MCNRHLATAHFLFSLFSPLALAETPASPPSPTGSGVQVSPQVLARPPAIVTPSTNPRAQTPSLPATHPSAGQPNEASNLPTGAPATLALRQGLAKGNALTLFIDVRDDQGKPLILRDKNQLKIEVGPYPTLVESLSPASINAGPNAGVAAIFLVDVSKSLSENRFAKLREALNQWVQGLGELDRMAIVSFGETVVQVQDYTGDRQKLQDAVAGLKPTDMHTRLFDALLRGLDLGQRRDIGLPDRRVIVLLSDGLDDTTDGATFQEVHAAMETSPLPVYAIGFDPGGTPAKREQGYRTLGGLARSSGGEFFQVMNDSFGETYSSVHKRLGEPLVAGVRCEGCSGDGRVYPVQLSLQEGSRIVSGTGHVRLLPGDTIEAPNPYLDWLPASVRPYWGALLGAILALIGLALLLARLRRQPEPIAAEIKPELPEEAVSETVTTRFIIPDEPTLSVPKPASLKEEDPGIRVNLSIVEGKRLGHRWGFMLQDQVSIGRNSANDVVLSDDPQVSGRHCVLIRQGDRIFVQDNQATNGTFVNGVEINTRYLLETGDVLGLGNTTLRINWD